MGGGNKNTGANAASSSSNDASNPSRKKSSVISVPAYDMSATMGQEGRNEEIVAEEGGLPAAQVVEDLEGDVGEAAGGGGEGEEGADDAEEDDDDVIDEPTNIRLQRVRKGFRLSSVCWEDQDGP